MRRSALQEEVIACVKAFSRKRTGCWKNYERGRVLGVWGVRGWSLARRAVAGVHSLDGPLWISF